MYGALAYNQEKVDRGDGKVLLTHIVREPADGRFKRGRDGRRPPALDALALPDGKTRRARVAQPGSRRPPRRRATRGDSRGPTWSAWAGEDNLISYSSIPTSDGEHMDHHQKDSRVRENGIPYAAFGLLWEELGTEILGEELAEKI